VEFNLPGRGSVPYCKKKRKGKEREVPWKQAESLLLFIFSLSLFLSYEEEEEEEEKGSETWSPPPPPRKFNQSINQTHAHARIEILRPKLGIRTDSATFESESKYIIIYITSVFVFNRNETSFQWFTVGTELGLEMGCDHAIMRSQIN
jgi:hypothetical protein